MNTVIYYNWCNILHTTNIYHDKKSLSTTFDKLFLNTFLKHLFIFVNYLMLFPNHYTGIILHISYISYDLKYSGCCCLNLSYKSLNRATWSITTL